MFCISGWGGVILRIPLTKPCLCRWNKNKFLEPYLFFTWATWHSVPQSLRISCVFWTCTLPQTPGLYLLAVYHNRLNQFLQSYFFLLAVCWHHTIFILQFTNTFPLVFISFTVVLSADVSCIFKHEHEFEMSNSTADVKNARDSLTSASLCRCPMSRWLQRTFWRFSSPGSPLWIWGQPTQTSAWPWPASSPSLTAPPPASSVHRLTVSTAFTPSRQNTHWYTPGKNGHTPSRRLPTKCKHFCLMSGIL